MIEIGPGEAVENCARALGTDADIICAQLESGECRAFKNEFGTSIIRVEPDTRSLVIVAYEGENARAVVEYWKATGRKNNLAQIRFHCTAKGAARMIGDLVDYEETIFKAVL